MQRRWRYHRLCPRNGARTRRQRQQERGWVCLRAETTEARACVGSNRRQSNVGALAVLDEPALGVFCAPAGRQGRRVFGGPRPSSASPVLRGDAACRSLRPPGAADTGTRGGIKRVCRSWQRQRPVVRRRGPVRRTDDSLRESCSGHTRHAHRPGGQPTGDKRARSPQSRCCASGRGRNSSAPETRGGGWRAPRPQHLSCLGLAQCSCLRILVQRSRGCLSFCLQRSRQRRRGQVVR